MRRNRFAKVLIVLAMIWNGVESYKLLRSPSHTKSGIRQYQSDCRRATGSAAPATSTLKLLRLTKVEAPAEEEEDRNKDEDYEEEIFDDQPYVDFQLTEKELQKLILNGKVQIAQEDNDNDADAMIEQLSIDYDDIDDEQRSKKRPWRKVQRIIRRQLIKVPKRYLKKFIRKIGLKRQLRSSSSGPTFVNLLPTKQRQDKAEDDAPVQEVSILMHGSASHTNSRFKPEQMFTIKTDRREELY